MIRLVDRRIFALKNCLSIDTSEKQIVGRVDSKHRVVLESPEPRNKKQHKKTLTFHYTGCLIGVIGTLIMD